MSSNPIKKLLGQTAVYGLPTIVGRLLNYFMVPLYTGILPPDKYGVVSELYAYVAFLIVLLTFGMETTFFKFFHDSKEKNKAFQNGFLTVLGFNSVFLLIISLFSQPIADVLLFPDHVEYIILLGVIVSIDAITAMPMAKLRAEQNAKRFTSIHFTAIVVNVLSNLVLLYTFVNPDDPSTFDTGVLCILVSNLLSSSVKIIGTYKSFLSVKLTIDKVVAKKMLVYAYPLVIAGFAGIINEVLDRVLLKRLLFSESGDLIFAETQLGIYSACYKLAMIVGIFLQAYRYAAEPFFFSQSKNKDKSKMYNKVMNYFVAAVCLVFLGVSLNIDIFKHFIRSEEYWVGLDVVPILLMANVFLGIYFNQSIWYKLSGQTKFGAYIAIGGATLTILINVIFIPIFGYYASAWATLIVYGSQMIASYLLGQKYYPIKYNLRKFSVYLGLAVFIFFVSQWVNPESNNPLAEFSWVTFAVNNSLILCYLFVVYLIEKPSKSLS